MEVQPSYEFTNNEWNRLPEAERISITEEKERCKRSLTNRYGSDTSSLAMSEIKTANANDVNTVHVQLKIIQQIISAVKIESNDGESFRLPSSIMGGRNEQANLRPRNQSGDWSICKIKIRSQSSSKCMILEPHLGTPDINKIDSNYETCCLGTKLIVMAMTERTADV